MGEAGERCSATSRHTMVTGKLIDLEWEIIEKDV